MLKADEGSKMEPMINFHCWFGGEPGSQKAYKAITPEKIGSESGYSFFKDVDIPGSFLGHSISFVALRTDYASGLLVRSDRDLLKSAYLGATTFRVIDGEGSSSRSLKTVEFRSLVCSSVLFNFVTPALQEVVIERNVFEKYTDKFLEAIPDIAKVTLTD